MAGLETISGLQNKQFLEERLNNVGHYRDSEPYDPILNIIEDLASGSKILRLGDVYGSDQDKKQHIFVFDPTRIEVKVEETNLEAENAKIDRSEKLSALKTGGYSLLQTGEKRVAGWKKIDPSQDL